MAVRVATWNVNSVRSRIVHLADWLRKVKPDIVLLQELKVLNEGFPRMEVEDLGYNLAIVGQKTYNGVAILSRHPMTVEATRLPGDDKDEHARYVEALVQAEGKVLRVASLYLPNGNPVDSDKYPYKLSWMDRLHDHARRLLAYEEVLVLGGDYNVAPTDDDVYDPVAWQDDALCRPETRAKYRRLLNLGLVDAYRALHAEPNRYTFWDYQSGRWQKDEGLAHRPSAAVAPGRRPALRRRYRPRPAQAGQALRPHAGLVRAGALGWGPQSETPSPPLRGERVGVRWASSTPERSPPHLASPPQRGGEG